MKVIYFHQYFSTPECSSGTRSYEMAKRLVKDGNDVFMITTSAFLDRVYKFNSGWNCLEVDGINVFVLKLPYSNSNSYFQRIYKFIYFSIRSSFKSLSIKADVIFATSTPLTIIIPALFFKFFKRKPLIFEVRDLWPEMPVAVGAINNRILIYIASKLESLAYFSAQKIIALSPGMASSIIEKGKNSADVITIPNSCDNALFRVDPEIGLRYRANKLNVSKHNKVVVYTGTLGAVNNVSYLVNLARESLSKGHRIHYYIFGEGAEELTIREFAENSGVLDVNLFMSPAVSKLEVVEILSASDVALSLFDDIPQMWANSANKFFDALAAGKPVGINYKGWQYDLMANDKFGVYLDCDNYQVAADNLNNFLFDEQKYNSAKDHALSLASNEFSRDKLYLKFNEVFKSL